MAAETGFLIDGKVYEVPTFDTFTTDENELMYERSAFSQEDFAREAGETIADHEQRVARMMRKPGLLSSLMQIAYQRGNPTVQPEKVRELIGRSNRLEVLSTLATSEEDVDESPLALTSEPGEASPRSSLESASSTPPTSESSGSRSTNGSDAPADQPPPTTALRSATSSTSPRTSSAA